MRIADFERQDASRRSKVIGIEAVRITQDFM